MQYIIAGLGNPEPKYKDTRHNIGFHVLDELENILNTEIRKSKFNSLFAEAIYKERKLFLVKPQTYMNLSGIAIAQIKNFYKINVSNLIVVHDELDLSLGTLRIKFGGGTAGHNGLNSIINSIGDNKFIRIRVGIGRPPENIQGSDYVLSKFSKKEKSIVDEVVTKACDAVLEIVSSDVKTAMNKFNNNNKQELK
ncbi:MAG: aminoacyl-tRNA hydrolase [Candidatus Dadabacteria bacterium]|nr:aminoacyl-tRNA hydrolase [Candidatus Dadabacteria bacterium]NIQ14962.1 aminoacyl-tRNA hydrolase [Candidatus Dadabacteria bacterium]